MAVPDIRAMESVRPVAKTAYRFGLADSSASPVTTTFQFATFSVPESEPEDTRNGVARKCRPLPSSTMRTVAAAGSDTFPVTSN